MLGTAGYMGIGRKRNVRKASEKDLKMIQYIHV
jgi:hypothetical protein